MMMTLIRLANRLALIYFKTPAGLRWIYWLIPILYFVLPFDLLPDLIPGLGRVDDILLVFFVIWVFERAGVLKNFFKQARTKTKMGQGEQAGTDTEEHRKEPLRPPHEVLGVAANAPPAEIKKAYRKLISRYHPDKFAHLGRDFEETARRKTQAIVAAYQQMR